MSLEALIKKVDDSKAAYLKAVETEPAGKVLPFHEAHMKAQAALASAIIEGADKCPGCKKDPHGMRQVGVIGKEVVHGFEIGCASGCKVEVVVRGQGRAVSRRSVSYFTREDVVKKWNGQEYIGGTPKAKN